MEASLDRTLAESETHGNERGLEQFPLLDDRVEKEVTTLWTQYKLFIDRGNVIDLAVGLVVGTAFGAIVTSFVSDILSPILGVITSSRLSEMFIVVRGGKHYPYNTREAARADGAVTLNYGAFVQTYINFVAISASLFVVMRIIRASRVQQLNAERIKECPFCSMDVPGKAVKCPKCTANIQ